MKTRIVWPSIFVVTLLVVGILNLPGLCGRDAQGTKMPKTHVVEAGDTLSDIAQKYLGDYRKYRYLAEINDLKIETIDGIDYVWLKVGQVIYLEPEIVLAPEIMKLDAAVVIAERMQRVFRHRHGTCYETFYADKEWALRPLRAIGSATGTEDARRLMKEALRRFEWVDMLLMWEAGLRYADSADDFLFLMAVVEAESDFRNVNGAHGEVGPMQIKPLTAWGWFKARDPEVWFAQVEELLENIDLNVACGWALLESYGCKDDKIRALHEYNRGSRRVAYAKRVMGKYRRNVAAHEAEMRETIETMREMREEL